MIFFLCLLLFVYSQAKEPLGILYFSDGKSLVQYNLDSEYICSYDIATGSPYAFYMPFPHKINRHIKMKPLVTQIYFPIVDKDNSVTYLLEKNSNEKKVSFEIHSFNLASTENVQKKYQTNINIWPLQLTQTKNHYLIYRKIFHTEVTPHYYSWGYTIIPKAGTVDEKVVDYDYKDIDGGGIWYEEENKLIYPSGSTYIVRTYNDLTSDIYQEKKLPFDSSFHSFMISNHGNKLLVLNSKEKDEILEIYDIKTDSWQKIMAFSEKDNLSYVISKWIEDDNKILLRMVKLESEKNATEDIYIYDLQTQELDIICSLRPIKGPSPYCGIKKKLSGDLIILEEDGNRLFDYELIILNQKEKKIIKTIPLVVPWKLCGWN